MCYVNVLMLKFNVQYLQVSLREEDDEISQAPHSFVVHRGKTGKFVQELCKDFRKVNTPLLVLYF